MRQALKEVTRKSRSSRSYLLDLVSSYALRQEISAFKGWLRKYPGYVAALVLLVVAVSFGWNLMVTEEKRVEHLRLQVSANSRLYEKKLEQKNQRLAAALSHLEDNPSPKAPGEKQLLIGQLAKLKWEYRKEISRKDQSAPKHSIVEIRSAEQPLLESRKILVPGEIAWHPIVSGKQLKKPGTFLWRVIPAELDSSRHQRDESNWGPYSVFTIYPSVHERIKATKKIRIGSYNVEQLDVGTKVLKIQGSCVDDSASLSSEDFDLLCSVVKFMKIDGLKPVVKRYSDIDNKLLKDLESGELDIAFGNISKAAYREKKKRIYFLEYTGRPDPVVLTNTPNMVDAEKVWPKEPIGIGTVKGTVYEHALGELSKKNPWRYRFDVHQDPYAAIDNLKKKNIQWVLLSKKTWEAIDKPNDFKLYPNEKSELLNLVRKKLEEEKIGGDAFAMTDPELCKAILQALQTIQKAQHLESRPCSSSSN